jgi:hypothetical protein
MTSDDPSRGPDAAAQEETRRWIVAFRRGFTRVFENVKLILGFLYCACALFVLLELVFVFHWADKEAHYGWENTVGFYAAYGFVSCVLLVFVAKYLLRPVVIRDEDYYDKPSRNRD